ncbi:MAG: helix-turn-helix domain-containing protein [Candidatus Heimdallarchaeota archaeon]
MTLPLTWKTDPLLLDEVLKRTKTLNELLQVNDLDSNLKRQLVTNPLMNFYGFLIRKRDFITKRIGATNSKVRILARMPFLPLEKYPRVQILLSQKSWLLAETSRDYFYQSALHDHSIKNWKQRVERYLERGAIPLPLLRGDEELWQQLTQQVKQEQQITIQSAKGKQSIIPLVLTEKLVYLLGIVDGDGHLSKHQVHIVDYSQEQIKQLQQFMYELFGVTGEIRSGKGGNYYILLVNSKWIVRLVQYLTGHPLGRKYEALQEPLILQKDQWTYLRGAYWRGLFDADASYKQAPTFTTISEKLTLDLKDYLDAFEINSTINTNKNGFTTYIYTGSRTRLYSQIGSWHPQKRKELLALLSRRRSGEIENFQGINEQKMTSDGFFDLSLLNNRTTINNFGPLMKQLRQQKNLTRKDLAIILPISYPTLATYENSQTNPSIKVALVFVSLMNLNFMSFLREYQLDYFSFYSSVKLPFIPSHELLQLMTYLHPCACNSISLLTTNPKVIQRIESFFDIKITKLELKRFNNYVLWDFLRTFGKYETIK